MSKQKEPAKKVKVTLSTGKVVLLNEMKISTSEKAAEMVAQRAGDSQTLMMVLMPKAILSLLIWRVDGEPVKMEHRDNLDSLFTVHEYGQLIKVVGKINGAEDDSKGEANLEFVSAEE